jgi:hypothetical protein
MDFIPFPVSLIPLQKVDCDSTSTYQTHKIENHITILAITGNQLFIALIGALSDSATSPRTIFPGMTLQHLYYAYNTEVV